MKKSRFTDEQIAFALRQAEGGTRSGEKTRFREETTDTRCRSGEFFLTVPRAFTGVLLNTSAPVNGGFIRLGIRFND